MNQKLQKRIVDIAYTIAPVNREMRTSHVAFLIKSGKIQTIGWNKFKTNPKNLKHPYHDGVIGTHAELDCIIKSGKEYLSGYTMVVIRINREGKLCNSKPCSGCQHVIRQFGIDDVYYTNQLGLFETL